MAFFLPRRGRAVPQISQTFPAQLLGEAGNEDALGCSFLPADCNLPLLSTRVAIVLELGAGARQGQAVRGKLSLQLPSRGGVFSHAGWWEAGPSLYFSGDNLGSAPTPALSRHVRPLGKPVPVAAKALCRGWAHPGGGWRWVGRTDGRQ